MEKKIRKVIRRFNWGVVWYAISIMCCLIAIGALEAADRNPWWFLQMIGGLVACGITFAVGQFASARYRFRVSIRNRRSEAKIAKRNKVIKRAASTLASFQKQ